MKKKYTLKDTLFKCALARGFDSEDAFDGQSKIMVVGGTATQLNCYNQDFLRATSDIDFIVDRATSNIDRRKWAEYVRKKIEQEGYAVTRGLHRGGAEVKFIDLGKDFFIHLDCFGKNAFEKSKKRLAGEYERAEEYNILGTQIRCQSPMDVIINKIRRINALEGYNQIELDPYDRYFFSFIKDAQFDLVNTEELSDRLENVTRERDKSLEDLSRYGFEAIKSQIAQYKVDKDIYDISLMIEACRKRNYKIPQKEFKKNLEVALV